MLEFDGKEVDCSKQRGASIYNFEWIVSPEHRLQVLATRVVPIKAPRDFRRYELLINGRSFFRYARPGELSPKRRGVEKEYVPLSILDIIYPGMQEDDVDDDLRSEIASEFDAASEGDFVFGDSMGEPQVIHPREEEIVFEGNYMIMGN
mmetsp:Transcript_65745/g.97375  ORF Transcript_65745/g.97375 Transcript_65745/m.97375 type:complete len:149 (+) Transcript_65745:264-710(+)